MTLEHIKLTYFNVDRTLGYGEIVKQFLVDSGTPHEYTQVERGPTWPEKKKELMERGNVFGAIPFIEFEGKVYGSSVPFMRLLSKRLGKYHGTNEDENYYVDMCADFALDWHHGVLRCYLVPGYKENYVKGERILCYSRFERVYGYKGGPYLMGEEISYADFIVYHNIDSEGYRYKLDEYPNLAKFVKAYEARPNLKDYIPTLPLHPPF